MLQAKRSAGVKGSGRNHMVVCLQKPKKRGKRDPLHGTPEALIRNFEMENRYALNFFQPKIMSGRDKLSKEFVQE